MAHYRMDYGNSESEGADSLPTSGIYGDEEPLFQCVCARNLRAIVYRLRLSLVELNANPIDELP